jgi:hypothetical protein
VHVGRTVSAGDKKGFGFRVWVKVKALRGLGFRVWVERSFGYGQSGNPREIQGRGNPNPKAEILGFRVSGLGLLRKSEGCL